MAAAREARCSACTSFASARDGSPRDLGRCRSDGWASDEGRMLEGWANIRIKGKNATSLRHDRPGVKESPGGRPTIKLAREGQMGYHPEPLPLKLPRTLQ